MAPHEGRVLGRLFPGAPGEARPWAALLWVTGRADLPGRPRPAEWRWSSEPSAPPAGPP